MTVSKITVLSIVCLIGIFVAVNVVTAQESIDPNFDPGLLVPDDVFVDVSTFGSAQGVQQFLEAQGSVLARTDAEFLVKLREPSDVAWKTKLEDPYPNLGRLRTAAEIIYDASVAAGINPQIMLVTLQKEQSLIGKKFTTETDLQRALDRALGYGCPDGSPCQAQFLGFYAQFFGTLDAGGNRWIGAPRSLTRSFYYEAGGVRIGRGPAVDANNNAYGSGPFVRTSQKGDTIVFQNTLGGFAGVLSYQTVNVKNFATAALYRYTPHVFNGNYNFWRFYRQWFRYPNGTVLKLQNDATLWVVDNGSRKSFSQFVATQRNINMTNPITVSTRELESYPDGGRLLPKEGSVIKSDASGVIYVIEGGKKREATAFTAGQRGIDVSKAVTLPHAEVESYESGPTLLPLEGSLIKAVDDGTVYVIVGEQKRALTYEVFVQRNYNFKDISSVPRAEFDAIATGPLMLPSDNTLIMGDTPAVYLLENGTKRIISALVFQQRGYSFKNIFKLPQKDIDAIPAGEPLSLADNSLIKADNNPTVYMLQGSIRVPMTGTVYMQRGLNTQRVAVLSQAEVEAYALSEKPLPPLDGSVVKASSSPAVYFVESGKLKLLTYEAFINRKLNLVKILIMDESELDLYEKGEVLQ